MEGLGSKFIEAWLYIDGRWMDERHINDTETLTTTVSMSLERLGGRFAVYECPDHHWQLFDRLDQTATCYPTKEAAEMVAIFNAKR